jgi:hypothetical protein
LVSGLPALFALSAVVIHMTGTQACILWYQYAGANSLSNSNCHCWQLLGKEKVNMLNLLKDLEAMMTGVISVLFQSPDVKPIDY